MKMLRVTCLTVAGGLLGACSSTQDDWSQATSQDTVPAYQTFLNKHPGSEYTSEAQDRVHALQEEEDWAHALNTNTAQALQDYLQRHPSGSHAAQASDQLTVAKREAAWDSAQAAGTVGAYQGFLQNYSQGTDADQARSKLAALEAYSVKLASFKSERQANKARDRLEGKYDAVLHDVVVVPPSAKEKLSVVRSAPMTEEEANSACATLKKSHQSCEVVKTTNS